MQNLMYFLNHLRKWQTFTLFSQAPQSKGSRGKILWVKLTEKQEVIVIIIIVIIIIIMSAILVCSCVWKSGSVWVEIYACWRLVICYHYFHTYINREVILGANKKKKKRWNSQHNSTRELLLLLHTPNKPLTILGEKWWMRAGLGCRVKVKVTRMIVAIMMSA